MKTSRTLLALVLVAACGASSCGPNGTGTNGDAGSSAPPNGAGSSKPASTVSGTSQGATSGAPLSSSAPKASSSEAATGGDSSASPSASAAPSAGGLASMFAGEPDPAISLSSTYETFGGTSLQIRKPVGWQLVTDKDLGPQLASTDGSAKLLVSTTKAGAPMTAPPVDLLPLTAAHDTKVGATVKGTLGKLALPLQLGEATARIADQKEAGRLYFMQIEVGGPSDVTAIAVLRAGVKPEIEQALFASIKSMKRARDQ